MRVDMHVCIVMCYCVYMLVYGCIYVFERVCIVFVYMHVRWGCVYCVCIHVHVCERGVLFVYMHVRWGCVYCVCIHVHVCERGVLCLYICMRAWCTVFVYMYVNYMYVCVYCVSVCIVSVFCVCAQNLNTLIHCGEHDWIYYTHTHTLPVYQKLLKQLLVQSKPQHHPEIHQ